MACPTRLLSFVLAGAIAAAIGACASPAVQECGATGVLCPAGTHCAAAQGICLPDNNTCGNVMPDPGEECDDGNIVDGDGCSHECKREECGNGIPDPGEVCDDGPAAWGADGKPKNGDGCSAD